MSKYAVIYDYDDGYSCYYNNQTIFDGDWTALQDFIKDLKKTDCYNIDATCIDDDYY